MLLISFTLLCLSPNPAGYGRSVLGKQGQQSLLSHSPCLLAAPV